MTNPAASQPYVEERIATSKLSLRTFHVRIQVVLDDLICNIPNQVGPSKRVGIRGPHPLLKKHHSGDVLHRPAKEGDSSLLLGSSLLLVGLDLVGPGLKLRHAFPVSRCRSDISPCGCTLAPIKVRYWFTRLLLRWRHVSRIAGRHGHPILGI